MTEPRFTKDTRFAHDFAQSKVKELNMHKILLKSKATQDIKQTLQAIRNLVSNEKIETPKEIQKFIDELEAKTLSAVEKL